MKITAPFLTLGLVFVMMAGYAHGAPTIEPPQDWCRISEEVTGCIGAPLQLPFPESLCPIEVCKSSYVRAEPCPLDGGKATARCEVKEDSTPFWACTNDASYSRMNVPIGCEHTNDIDCFEITVCNCEQRATTRTKFVFKRNKEPTCNADASQLHG